MARAHFRTVLAEVQAALEAYGLLSARLTVGLSGGMDSVTLLDALVQLRARHGFSLRAVHVHHGISPNADSWSAACASLCAGLAVPLSVVEVSVSSARGEGLEAAARAARYAVFRTQDADALLLAHHADDQAETVLMQLMRGGGLPGLAAMPRERMLDASTGLRLIRPLLQCSRADIVDYASARGLNWVEDESNVDPGLERNFVRLRVLPLMAQRYPGYRETLGRVAANLGEAQRLLDYLAEQDAAQPATQRRLELSRLRVLDPARQRNVLRWFLRENDLVVPGRERLASALRQLLEARADAQPRVALGRCSLRRHRGWIVLEPDERPSAAPWALAWDGASSLILPDRSRLDFREVRGEGVSRARLTQGEATVRTRSGGERLRPAANRPTRTLKNLLQEAGIPAWRRASMPLVFAGEDLVWAAGVGYDCRYAAAPGEAGVAIEWIAC